MVSLTVLHNNAIGKLEAKMSSFSHHCLLANNTTVALITKNAVTILRPLHASAIATTALTYDGMAEHQEAVDMAKAYLGIGDESEREV